MADDSGLTQDEIDSLLEGSGLDDFDSSYVPDEEEDIFSVDSGSSQPQQETPTKTTKKKTAKSVDIDKMDTDEILDLTNLELINDIKMTLSVEIGRTRMPIREILELGKGSLIELNKMNNEPVDILINNMLIAKGVVVTISDDFGVKITEIISPDERFKFLLS
ncbi:MAG: flagellar motor switch protein FliN [Spirochaetota bacterium]